MKKLYFFLFIVITACVPTMQSKSFEPETRYVLIPVQNQKPSPTVASLAKRTAISLAKFSGKITWALAKAAGKTTIFLAKTTGKATISLAKSTDKAATFLAKKATSEYTLQKLLKVINPIVDKATKSPQASLWLTKNTNNVRSIFEKIINTWQTLSYPTKAAMILSLLTMAVMALVITGMLIVTVMAIVAVASIVFFAGLQEKKRVKKDSEFMNEQVKELNA